MVACMDALSELVTANIFVLQKLIFPKNVKAVVSIVQF